MKWRRESWVEFLRRYYDTWLPRYSFFPRHCRNNTCGVAFWFEWVLSRVESGYSGDERLWVCSEECAEVVGL